MIEVTVKLLALKIKTSVDRLIKQFADAGIYKKENDLVSQKEKEALLIHLNHDHKNTSKKLILQRKIKSILNIPNNGKNKSINIEIRKKRTYVKKQDYVDNDIKIKNIEKNKKLFFNDEDITKKIKIASQVNNVTNLNNNENVLTKKTLKNKKINNNKKSIKNIKKQKTSEKDLMESIRKSVKSDRIRLEKETKRIDKEAKRITKEKRNNLINFSEEIEDNFEYHINTNKNIHNNEEKKRFLYEKNNRWSKNNKNNNIKQNFYKPIKTINKDITIGEQITIFDLANKMAIKSSQVIKSMIKMGFASTTTIHQNIDQETAQLIAEEMGHKVILIKDNYLEESIMQDRDISIKKEKRFPIVTIMGHVDHGKTTLLDYIRSTNVALKEIGGITQHIGSYHIKTKDNQGITFLDTPGHAAFTAMRSRGTKITDIVVLVIAADDGLMPQTIEAIKHAQASKVPIIVAINKIDKVKYNLKKIQQSLSNYNIIPEKWGGDNIFVEISAKLGTGINNLIDAILLQSEVMDLYTTKLGMASGVVIESYLDKGFGPVASILISEGTLKKGDTVLCGLEYGKIRSIHNELNKEIKSIGPSIPVKIFGLSGIPIAGDKLVVVRSEKKAREVALYRQKKFREIKLDKQQKNKLDFIYSNIMETNILPHDFNIILKADVQGSLEALNHALLELSTDDKKIKVIYSGVGNITETDVLLASTSSAMILAFNVRIDNIAKKMIEVENLSYYNDKIIYNIINKVKKIINNTITTKKNENIIGIAEVRNVFKSQKLGVIAGCMVIKGIIQKNKKNIRIIRNKKIIYEGELESLRRFKDDVSEVQSGIECGINVKNFHDIHNGDIIEVWEALENKK